LHSPVPELSSSRLAGLLRWIGGVPVQRTAPGGAVGQMVHQMRQAQAGDRLFWLGLSPEGTRKHLPGWRSGFYQTALQAQVPLCLVQLDYARRRVVATHFYRLSGDEQADMAHIVASFVGVQGFRPQGASPIVLLKPAPASPPPPQDLPPKPPTSLAS
jgi:1-acyl-sn-glycerol-3-phosphate acyltransferase